MLNREALEEADFFISRVFWTSGRKVKNTRVLEGWKSSKPLDFIGI